MGSKVNPLYCSCESVYLDIADSESVGIVLCASHMQQAETIHYMEANPTSESFKEICRDIHATVMEAKAIASLQRLSGDGPSMLYEPLFDLVSTTHRTVANYMFDAFNSALVEGGENGKKNDTVD